MKRNRWSLTLGLLLLLLFGAFTLFPQLFAPYTPKEMFAPWQSVSRSHPLGTNDMGYDLFSELIYATGTTLTVGVWAAVLALGLGALFGLLAGSLTGLWGEAADLVIQVFLLLPLLPTAIVAAAFLGSGRLMLILTMGLLGWSATAKAVRARVRQLWAAPFVEALTILDIPRWKILFSHLLPNLVDLLAARFILSITSFILLEATLSFLGLGDPTQVTWGGMISLAYKHGGFSRGAANWFLAPGLCITLLIISFYCLHSFFEARGRLVHNTED